MMAICPNRPENRPEGRSENRAGRDNPDRLALSLSAC